MTAFDEFRHLSTLLGVVEKLGSPNRLQTLTFRDAAGSVVGGLTLDAGMIRLGVHIEGQPGSDDEFMREATPYSTVLKRLLERAPLESAEIARLEGVRLLLRRVFRSLTARTLRRLASRCDPGRIEVQVVGESEAPPSARDKILNYAFPPVELLLTAGRSGTVRYADAAARIYETPPNAAEQRWLFEWQADDLTCPWPVMTTRQAEVKLAAVAQVGMLGQALSHCLTVTQAADRPTRVRSQLVCSDAYVYYLVSTQQYFALTIYQFEQLERVVKSLEELVGSDCAADVALLPSSVSSGRTKVSSAINGSVVVPVVKVAARWPAEVVTKPGLGAPWSMPGPSAPTAAPTVRNVHRVAVPVVAGTQDSPSKVSRSGEAAAGVPDAQVDSAPSTAPASVRQPAVAADRGKKKEETPVAVSQGDSPSRSSPSAEAEEWLVAAALVDPVAPFGSPPAPAGLAAPLPAVAATLPAFAPPGTSAASPLELDAQARSSAEPPADAVLEASPRERKECVPATSPSESASELADQSEGPTVDFPVPVELVSPAPPPQSQPEPAPPQESRLEPPLASRPDTVPSQASAPAPPPPNPVATAAPVGASTYQATAVASIAEQVPSWESPLLTLSKFSARLEGRTILKDVELKLGRRGVYALMGPGGSGKSSLLGILSGRNRAGTGWMLSGEIIYDRSLLGSAERPATVGQRISRPAVSLRSYLLGYVEYPDRKRDGERIVEMLSHCGLDRLVDSLDSVLGNPPLRLSDGEWWRLAVARELLAHPPLLCVDEPTAGLLDSEAQAVVSLLKAEGQRRTVLLVSHHQQHVRQCSDYVILLAAGQLQEFQPTEDFFERPRSKAARNYVRTGGCYVPSPDTKAEDLDLAELADAEPASVDPSASEELAAAPAIAPLASVLDREPPSAPLSADVKPLAAAASQGDAGSLASGVLWRDSAPVLRLRGFGVTFGNLSVIAGMDLDIAASGIHLLVIPDGMQKRLLLRALCGPQSSQLQGTGQALYLGNELSEDNAPALAAPDVRMMSRTAGEYLAAKLPSHARASRDEQREQAAQLAHRAGFPALVSHLDQSVSDLELLEWRVLYVLSTVSTNPALLCLDEPLVQMSVDDQNRLLAFLRQLAKSRALLIMAQDPSPFMRDGGQPGLVQGL